MSLEDAVLIEPASCVTYALDRLAPQHGEALGIIGVGTLGSLAILLARRYEPREVVAYGITDEDVELALELGADRAINLRRPGTSAFEDVDIVFEAAGSSRAVQTALTAVRKGGRVALAGSAGDQNSLEIPTDVFMRKDLSVYGSFSYTTEAWARTMKVFERDGLDFSPLLTHRFSLENYEDAFAVMERRGERVVKVLLEHSDADD
jgi:threonine dehydrogenase-like Zn-dependent dehydrogenase